MSQRLRGLVLNLALSGASLLVVLLLVEAALRLAGVAPTSELATRRIFDGRWTLLLDCFPSNPRGYFPIDLRLPEHDARYRRLAPNRFDAIQRFHPWAVEFRYNALRFRDAPLGPKPAGRTRVMVLGDSFTEGQGVKEQDTASRVLGRLLEAEAPGRFEVRNCGRRATDFPALAQELEDILPYEPDIVVYALVLNDAEQPEAFRARQEYLDDWILDRQNPPDTQGPPAVSAWRSRILDVVAGRVQAWRVGRETTRWYLDMWSDANPGWPRTQEEIRVMDRRLKERGARLLVAPWPLFVGLEGRYPFAPVHDTIRRFCLAEGIAHHDTLPVFLGRRSSDFWVHAVDRHPNELAHRLAAESLAPVVLRLAER